MCWDRFSKFGGKCFSVVGDFCYVLLEKVLFFMYDKRIKISVINIVDIIEFFYKFFKSVKEVKFKWEEKIYVFMKEVGISWVKD